jgi:3-dehydroquinate dehydratase / shikimate dehydrogenase
MTQICVSLTDETTTAVIDRMADLASSADLFEIRADLILDLDLLTILRAKTRPLILTCRAASEGGRWPDADPRRRLTLLEGVKRGYDYVDVEYQSDLLDVMGEKAGRGLIVSYHDFTGMPDDLGALYTGMCARGADVVKIAVTPRSIADVARLMDFAAGVAGSGGAPFLPIALGPLGTLTRILAARLDAPFTYAAAAAGLEAAPGQLLLGEMADLFRVRSISPATKAYGILGSDVTRSLSPLLHNRAFAARQLDAVYVHLQAEALPPFIEAIPALGLSGFSVTRPYKVEILKYLHEVEEEAALCGSVNTVVVEDGTLRGSTTDGHGIVGPLKKRRDLKGRPVVILGAGGAARSAAFALARRGAAVTVLGRDPSKAAAVATAVGCAFGSLADIALYPWDVVINATPLGSSAAPEETPVPASLHRPDTVAFDMVYDPLETRFLREAQSAGAAVITGLEMLLAQAIAQFETWTGLEAPVEAMRSAALMAAEERES